MYKTVALFRYDIKKGRAVATLDACATADWTNCKTPIESFPLISEINPGLKIEDFVTEDAKQLARAMHGMEMRARYNRDIYGPYVFDHEGPELPEKVLIQWFKKSQRQGKK